MNMSQFKQASEQITGIFEQSKIEENIMTKRNHPFFPDWEEWMIIAARYHSPEVSKLQNAINKAYREYQVGTFCTASEWMIDEIYFSANKLCEDMKYDYYRISRKSVWFKVAFEHKFYQPYQTFLMSGICQCTDFPDGMSQFPEYNCDYKEEHMRAHILSYLWAWYKLTKPRRSLRRYYKRLERIILSLPFRYLRHFTPELITRPNQFSDKGRNLLREFYLRGIFDPVKIIDFAEKCEVYKHFMPREQGGFTSQCGSESILDEMIEIAERLFQDDNSVMDYCAVREQGPFDIQHKVSWRDEDFTRLKDLLDNAREEFCKSLSTTILRTARAVMVMFVITTIVCLLSRIAVGAAALIIYKLIHLICGLIFGVEDKEAINSSLATEQGPEEITSIPILPRLITKYIINPPSSILTTLWNSKQTDLIMKRISYLGDVKLEKGFERLTHWVRKVVHQTVRWFCQTYLGVECAEELEGDNHAINNWQDDVDDLLRQYYDGTLVWTEATWAVVYNLYSRGVAFTRSPAYIKDKSDVWKVVSKLGNLLEQFKKHNTDGHSIRNPPVTIYLYGETGVGKSTLTYPLAVEMLKKIFKKENNKTDLKKHWKNLIYMRSAEQEYWDGYQNQLVTLFDDFNQQSDSASNPSIELFEIIRSSNCFPYPLHMAALEEKATTNFTSKIIIASSNNKRPKTQSLNYPKALERRFDLAIEVSRKSHIKLDKDAPFDSAIWNFSLYDMVSGETIKENVTYDELIDMGVIEYFSRQNFVSSIEKSIEQIFEREEEVKETPIEQGNEFDWSKDDSQYIPRDDETFYKPWYTRLYQRIYNWLNPSVMDELRMSLYLLRKRTVDRFREFRKMQNTHSYLSKIKQPLMLLTGGLAFITLYFGIKKIMKPKPSKLMTEKEYMTSLLAESASKVRIASRVLAEEVAEESYTPQQIRPKAESYTHVQPRVVKSEAYTPQQIRQARAEMIVEEGVADLNAAEVLISASRKNLYKIYEENSGKAIGHVLFLKGHVCVMPRHFIRAFKQCVENNSDSVIYFKGVFLRRSFALYTKDLLKHIKTYESPEEGNTPVFTRDIMALTVPTSIVHQDITAYFCKRNQLQYCHGTKVQMPVLVSNDINGSDRAVLMVRYSQGDSKFRRLEDPLSVANAQGELVRYIRDAWEYSLDTQPTECGAPLIVRNKSIHPGKICGIHIAGVEKEGLGFSTPLYEEDVQIILSSFKDEDKLEQKEELEMKPFPTEQCLLPDDAEFIRLGQLEKPVNQPTKSKIQPSLVYGKIRKPVTRPTLLRPKVIDGELFDPRSFRINKLGNITKPISEKLIQTSKQACIDEMASVLVGVDLENTKAVYTFEEAVKGIDGEPYINSLKRSTSAGFPFVQKGQNKYTFFGDGDQFDLSNKNAIALKERVNFIIDQAKQGKVLDHYFMDTLKDERKPLHKYHKTRLFSAGPMDYLIACKMYFNGIVNLLSKSRNDCHLSVGTNPYSMDWNRIAVLLERKSKHMIAGDFEGFDASQQQRLLIAAGEVLIELSRKFCGSTEEDCLVMRVLLASLVNSRHVIQDEVYQWTHALPSGHYLTAIINSVFVNIVFTCVWQIAFNTITYVMARAFFKECGIVAYGDDHIVSVPKSRLDKFNQMTLPALFAQIGLSYTMEDKDAIAELPARPLSEVSYLKRKFRYDVDRCKFLAPLSMDTVLETPMWMHDCIDPKTQTIENIEWAIKELSLHDADTWNQWHGVFVDLQEKMGYYTVLKDQQEVVDIVCAQDLKL